MGVYFREWTKPKSFVKFPKTYKLITWIRFVLNLGKRREKVIFQSFFITLEVSNIYELAWSKTSLSLKKQATIAKLWNGEPML